MIRSVSGMFFVSFLKTCRVCCQPTTGFAQTYVRYAGNNSTELKKEFNDDGHETDIDDKQSSSLITNKDQPNSVNIDEKPIFPEVVHKVVDKEVGFWNSERGLQLKDAMLTGSGRTLRMFVSIERYDNWWENAMFVNNKFEEKLNRFDDNLFTNHGPEWAVSFLVLINLGGALKFVTDDRWVDNVGNIRTPEKKDCTVEAIDLRKSGLNILGMKYFENIGYVRYLNLADSKYFDNHCMACLHPLADVLEYLDISGTSVTPAGFAYLRIFTRLRWLNISRLPNMRQIESLLPFLQEILPSDCVVITDDDIPPESYGTEIPYRNPRNPAKDVELQESSRIGDTAYFSDTYGRKALQVYDASAIHKLWKTPIISKNRLVRINNLQVGKKSFFETIVEYIRKAENYKPLL